jgi:DNA-binding transcriptional LysR family regulator
VIARSIGGVELRALRYFVTVAEELHFGRAAQRLGIVQPAVSQQVARLERELGVRLLDRTSRTVRLTEAGHRVLDAARDALAAAEKVRAVAHRLPGTVRIGTAPGLTGRLERGIDALRVHNPRLDVVLVDLPVTARVTAVRQGELDLALARGPVTAPGVRVLPAWSEPLHAVVSTRHPLAKRDTVSPHELAGDVLRVPSHRTDPPLHDAITAALRETGVRPPLGRPAGTVEATVVEVGADPASWTLLPADQLAGAASTRVRALPLDPPLSVTGNVITPVDDLPELCTHTTVAAFR